jgi:hypothetical protein
MSPRRASLPPPLPPLRVCPDTSPRFRSGRARSVCSLPPPTPGGGKITKTKTACATCSPFPTPPPARAWPSTSLRFRSGPCPSRLLAAPPHSRWGLLITSIHTFQHNYCVSAPPSPGRFFFPLLDRSPGPMPRYASAWAQAIALAKVFRLRTP